MATVVTPSGHVVVNIGEVVRSEMGQKRIRLAKEIVRRSREKYEMKQPLQSNDTSQNPPEVEMAE